MTLTVDMSRKAENVYIAFKRIVPFYSIWESLVGTLVNSNMCRFCRYCGLLIENNQTVCIECGA